MFNPSANPIGSKFKLYPESNLFSLLFCYQRSNWSYHHLFYWIIVNSPLIGSPASTTVLPKNYSLYQRSVQCGPRLGSIMQQLC